MREHASKLLGEFLNKHLDVRLYLHFCPYIRFDCFLAFSSNGSDYMLAQVYTATLDPQHIKNFASLLPFFPIKLVKM